MTRLAVLFAVVLAASACGTDSPPEPVGLPATTIAPATAQDIAELRADLLAEVGRVEAEVVKSNTDREDLRRKVDTYIARASRSQTRVRAAARSGGACWGWAHLVYAYDWPHSTACAVLGCESRGDPNAANPRSSARGLFQILGGPLDPAANVALAYRMWRARGWQPWNVGGCP